MRNKPKMGFTLIELLVVVAIIALLIGILIPSLGKAKKLANSVVCGSNMSSIGKGLTLYNSSFDGKYPLSYIYNDTVFSGQAGSGGYIGPGTNGGTQGQTPSGSANGYLHWSYFVYNQSTTTPADGFFVTGGAVGPATGQTSASFTRDDATISAAVGASGLATLPTSPYAGTNPKAFTCPEFTDGGGLPPTDPFSDQFAPGQASNGKAVVDFQAPRCAFTLNEAVCPRGKLIYAYNNGGDGTFPTPSRWVKDIEISRPGSVILATEFCTNFSVVTGFDSTTGTPGTCKSHRPVTGFKVDGEKYVELNDFKPDGTSQWRVCTPTDLWDNSNSAYNGGGAGTGGKTADALNNQSIQGSNFAPGIATTAGEDQAAHNGSRLDWVGRNHPGGKTNFLFCDGHVENKTKEETLPTTASVLSGSGGEWGEKPYGLVGY